MQTFIQTMSEAEKGDFTTSEFYKQKNIKPPPRGAVLVFLPGFVEIDTLYKHLMDMSAVKSGYVTNHLLL